MVNIFICLNKDERITSLNRCTSILVVDVDEKKIVDEIKVEGIIDPDFLDDYFDKYDPHILFTCNINEELALSIEEYGVHVYIVKNMKYNDLLDEIYGFRV